MICWMYILECSDGSYYTGSTKDLERRLTQHQAGEGANHTKKRLPVKLVYFEEFDRIDYAFNREKQVQGWSRKKKEALINGDFESLSPLSVAYRDKKKEKEKETVSSRTSDTLEQTKKNNNPTKETEVLEGDGIFTSDTLEQTKKNNNPTKETETQSIKVSSSASDTLDQTKKNNNPTKETEVLEGDGIFTSDTLEQTKNINNPTKLAIPLPEVLEGKGDVNDSKKHNTQ